MSRRNRVLDPSVGGSGRDQFRKDPARRPPPPSQNRSPAHNQPSGPHDMYQNQQQPYHENETQQPYQNQTPPQQSYQDYGDEMNAPHSLDQEEIQPCDPLYFQVTSGAWPANEKILGETRMAENTLRCGATIQPLNDHPALPEIEIVNFGSLGVLRCKSCRAYVNPYITLKQSCRAWQCNFCGDMNEIKSTYYDMLRVENGQPSVRRPELCSASIEIVAPEEYMVRPPQAPVYLFAICVNKRAINSGMLALTCETILANIEKIPGLPRTRFGLVTYSDKLHFYDFNGETPKMFVCSDVENPYLPFPAEDLICSLEESKQCIIQLLTDLPNYFNNENLNDNNCMGAAVQACWELLESYGGRVMVFNHGFPNVGMGKLVSRSNERHTEPLKQHLSLKRSDDYYLLASVNFAKIQASCDLFACSDGYCDLPTIGSICQQNGGDIRLFHHFHEEHDGDKFTSELTRFLTRAQGWEAVIRIRTSRGFDIGDHYGHFHMRARNLVVSPCFHADQSMAIQIKCKDSAKNRSFNHLFVQGALLYTSSDGQRRIRVHTVRVPLVTSPAQVISNINVNPYMNLICRQAAQKFIASDIIQSRTYIQNSLVNVLSAYTKSTHKQIHNVESLPYNIQTWPDVVLGALKCRAFRDRPPSNPDIRFFHFCWLNTAPQDRVDLYLRPSMYAISELYYEPSYGTFGENYVPTLPPELPLTENSLNPDSIFLINDGLEIAIWVGRQVDPNILIGLFGIEDIVDRMALLAPADGDPQDSLLNRLYNLLDYFRESCIYQKIVVVCQDSNSDLNHFRRFFYEDRTDTVMGREEFTEFIRQQSASH